MNSHILSEFLFYCLYAKRWIISETPKKCCNYYHCESCEYYIKRPLNRYIKRKLLRLQQENISKS